jgi:lipopolysaccharide/colanic/teichoic acid biosynthesis glycosyltransferase
MERRVMGRSLDRIVALAGLTIMAVPMAIIALAVLVSMGRPILFRQHQAGLGNVPFELVKFRTMMLRGERVDPAFLEKAHASNSRRSG